MGKMTIADRFNAAYKEIVNDNKISDCFANNQSREYISRWCPELNVAVTEFLATMMAVKPDVRIDFRDNINGVILDCEYDDVRRRLVFNDKGTIVLDKSYTENNKERQ